MFLMPLSYPLTPTLSRVSSLRFDMHPTRGRGGNSMNSLSRPTIFLRTKRLERERARVRVKVKTQI